MRRTLLICTGPSGSGKSYFIKNILPDGLFYNLKSATTRPMRDGEVDGREYYFRDESYFDHTPMATHLWVNEQFWQTGQPKWLYGVPESEVAKHRGQHLVYDVIQPRYARQLIDWFNANGLGWDYDYRVAYFLPPVNNMEMAHARANMPNDMDVRRTNTCLPADFMNADLGIDYILQPTNGNIPVAMRGFISALAVRAGVPFEKIKHIFPAKEFLAAVNTR